jgi:hypothetical protein
MYRPAWRISQIGVASTGKSLQARKKREVGSADEGFVWVMYITVSNS